MIIWGWLSRFTILGVKLEECLTCGGVCEHVVGRKTSWAHVFWFPIFPYQVAHLMLCTTCHAETKLSRRDVNRAMQTGLLHLDRPRPNSPAILEAEAARATETGETPPDPALVFEQFLVNPKRGPWDLYLRAYPFLVLAIVGVVALGAVMPSILGPGGRAVPTTPPAGTVLPHECWEDETGTITGCRMADGTITGDVGPSKLTCFFSEPLPADASLRCIKE